MINSTTEEYYRNYYGAYLGNYIRNKNAQDTRFNYILAFIIICILLATIALAQPLLAKNNSGGADTYTLAPPGEEIVYSQVQFEQSIRQKYRGSTVTFPKKGIAHIKKTKYINSKPIKINIVEINTKVNPYLKVKPQIASEKLNSKSTVRRIAQKERAIIAINGGFFKPQTGVPLGALMIDEKILTGPIYNRVGIGIFENEGNISYKMDNINFNISIKTKHNNIKVDNINQPRMLQTYTLLYTSDWGKSCPVASKIGYNMLIRNNQVVKISANPIEMTKGDIVISANKDIISKIAKDGKITVDLKLQAGFENAKHIISAGPYLVKDSQIYVDYKTQKLQAISGKNPRSAIGFKNDGTLIIVTVDGREKQSVGMTLGELASLMKGLECVNAMNFDGGSSSAMYVNGRIANSAINKEGISVSNALVIKEQIPNDTQIAGIEKF